MTRYMQEMRDRQRAVRALLFSGPMVRAILDGAKTQTRRLVKPDAVHECGWVSGPCRNVSDGSLADGEDGSWSFGSKGVGPSDPLNFYVEHQATPLVQPGDTLWVREAWRTLEADDHLPPSELEDRAPILYLADETPGEGGEGSDVWGRYRPARFMPRWASRLTLRVTDVRVERLGDISEADARAEGLRLHAAGWTDGVNGYDTLSARDAFAELWEHVHRDGAWERDRSRWVWVYGFEVVR